MSQVALQPRDTRSNTEAPPELRAAPPPSGQPGPASRELLTAWLLMLLDGKASHGYDLRRQLDVHGVATESGAMYRTLRKLEQEGCASSSWEHSAAGPRRRLYTLTAKGRRELTLLVDAITMKRDVHAAFLIAHAGQLA